MTFIEQRERLIDLLTDAVGSLVDVITIDAQTARPLPGKAVILVEPPDIDWESYAISNATWRCDVIAGTTTTQVEAMDLIFSVIEKLQASNVNMADAKPVSFSQGPANLAAYQITFNPFD